MRKRKIRYISNKKTTLNGQLDIKNLLLFSRDGITIDNFNVSLFMTFAHYF